MTNLRQAIFNQDRPLGVQEEYLLAMKRLKIIHVEMNNQTQLTEFDKGFFDERITNYVALSDLWKLGVDGRDHIHGRLAYDKGTNANKCSEYGYIDAMETALGFMFRSVDAKLSVQLICQLYSLACCNVKLSGGGMMCRAKDLDLDRYPHDDVPSFTLFRGRCPIEKKYLTREGLNEISETPYLTTFTYRPYYPNPEQPKTVYLTKDNIDEFWGYIQNGRGGESGINEKIEKLPIFEQLLDEYHCQIAAAATDNDRLLAIATLARKIEGSHFFFDGNLRTVRLVILKLLIQNKLPLTCMEDPNIIDGFSSKEIAEKIQEGMATYKSFAPSLSDTKNHTH